MQMKNVMPPPWLAYPEIERYSIGWRMGYGESYIMRFSNWLNLLSKEKIEEYKILFPEPITWKGWWEEDFIDEVLVHNEYCIPIWQQNGTAKYSVTQLQQEIINGQQHDLYFFWGHQPSKDGSITKSCLSQWWKDEFWAIANNYCCMEQFMMEQKADLFKDEEIREQILENKSPSEIKKLGRKIQGFDQVLWDKFKYSIVLNGNWCKFSQNRKLRDFLISTGNSVLVEASPFDAVWGIHLSENSIDAKNPLKWKGQNLLGFALMEVRDELIRVTKNESLCDWSALDN